MNINQDQSSKYLEEAELTLLAAEAVFKRAKDERRQLWANVVKSCYDCMEQALSSALASRGEVIPREHPAKVKLFINLFRPSEDLKQKIFFWLGRRARAQYVDMVGDKLYVPHELFTKDDAEKALTDCRHVLKKIKEYILNHK
ncbi:MAG: HEPN domain-containing protein [Nanoarchaeota archaeon]